MSDSADLDSFPRYPLMWYLQSMIMMRNLQQKKVKFTQILDSKIRPQDGTRASAAPIEELIRIMSLTYTKTCGC